MVRVVSRVPGGVIVSSLMEILKIGEMHVLGML